MARLHNLVHTHHVARKRVALRTCNLAEIHLVVHRIRMMLPHVVAPSRGASRTAGGTKRNGILAREDTNTDKTLAGDDITRKDIMIILYHASQVFDKLLHLALEVRMQIRLHTAYHVIVLNQASARSLLHNVQNHLPLPESVEERSQSAHIHHQTRVEQQMRVDTLQLVHYGADILRAFRNLYSRRLLDAHAQRMTVLMRAQIVQPVRQRQSLLISKALVHLFYTAVDISQNRVYTADILTVDGSTHTQHTMSGRMLRTDVHHEILLAEHHILMPLYRSVRTQSVFLRHVGVHLILHVQRIRVHIVVLAQRESLPVLAQEDAAHVRISREADAEEIEHLAFLDLCRFPQMADRRQKSVFPVRSHGFKYNAITRGSTFQIIQRAQSFFSPVHSYDVAQIVHRFCRIVFQLLCLNCQFFRFYNYYIISSHNHFSSFSGFSSFSLRFTPPRKRSTFIFLCSCIIP